MGEGESSCSPGPLSLILQKRVYIYNAFFLVVKCRYQVRMIFEILFDLHINCCRLLTEGNKYDILTFRDL